jgi:hypothetical protein
MKKEKIEMIGEWKFTLEDIFTHEKKVFRYRNLITVIGRTAITDAFVNASPACSLLITHACLGTNATAVNEADTALGTETYRNGIASRTSSGNVAYLTAFFTAGECNGNYKEAGLVIDGTGEDILINHVNIDVAKTNTQTLTIDTTITLSNA